MKENFGLYLILTHPLAGYEVCAKAAVDCGVRYLQLRMKNMPRPAVLETARAIRAITHGSRTLFIVNDDLAIGGINADNLPDLLDTGISNFCVLRAVNKAINPAAAIDRLKEIWKKHHFWT